MIPCKQLKYKGYYGSIEQDDSIYYGQALNVGKDLISYEGDTLEALEEDFREAINSYSEIEEE